MKAAREAIENDSAISRYLNYSKERHADLYQGAKRYFKGSNANLIGQYSNAFDHSIEELKRFIARHQVVNEEEFFQSKAALDDATQSGLWLAQRNFVQILEAYLDTETSSEIQFYKNTKAKAQQELTNIKAVIDSAPVGTRRTFMYSFALIDTTLVIPVIVQKNIDGIKGDDRYNLIPSYLEILEYNIESPKKQKVRAVLQEVKHAFQRKGSVKAPAKEYYLSSLTPAELTSLYKYLSFVKSELDVHFTDVVIGRIP